MAKVYVNAHDTIHQGKSLRRFEPDDVTFESARSFRPRLANQALLLSLPAKYMGNIIKASLHGDCI